MALTQPSDTMAMIAITMATDSSITAHPFEDDGSGNLPDPNMRLETDLQSLLSIEQKSLYELQKKQEKMMFKLKIGRQQTKMLEKDCNEFRLSCKNTAKQSVDALNLAITHLLKHLRRLKKSPKKNV
jgi:hypothetical protein